MAREGVVVGLKDSSGDDGNFRYVLSDLKDRPDISLMTGSEIVVDSVLAMGAHGVVPGLGNVDPAGYVRLWDAAQRGDWAAVQNAVRERIQFYDDRVAETVERLHREITAILKLKETADLLQNDGVAPAAGGTPAEFAAFIRSETAKWAAVVKVANIQAE